VVHGTFSGESANKRLPVHVLQEHGYQVFEFDYATVGRANQNLSNYTSEHVQCLHDNLGRRKGFLVSYSQGVCVALDELTQLSATELDNIEEQVLLSPAEETVLDVELTQRMEGRCRAAESKIAAMIEADPNGAMARLMRDRTTIAMAKGDIYVENEGNLDSLPSRRCMVARGHLAWIYANVFERALDIDQYCNP
jgi:hypothetical protein